MPRLVDEDEERQAEDRDEDAHAADANLPCCEPPCLLVGLDELAEIARGRAVDLVQRIVHEPRDLGEADAAVEKRSYRDLVRSVERARVRPAALARLARERSSGKRSRSGGSNSSRRPAEKSSPGTDVVLRSGCVSANEIGTRMSGYPRCASAAPSRNRTSAWTTDVGCTTTSILSYGRPKR